LKTIGNSFSDWPETNIERLDGKLFSIVQLDKGQKECLPLNDPLTAEGDVVMCYNANSQH
jgi:hypothetical protein